ncbi:MAG: S-formylglutathione hydrolase [Parerythrobacter sp.]
METVSENRSHGGVQGVYRHASAATGTDMTFAVYVPDHEEGAKLPVLWFLSGLTCDHSNVMEKGEFRAACAEHGIVFVAPDTSPRGDAVADNDAYDMGKGAGFYLDATQAPWAQHYRMRSYLESELPDLVADRFPVDMTRQSVMGHSMGGMGALAFALRQPDRFQSASALAPICAPSQVPWGEKAFGAYLGEDRDAWRTYDPVALIEDGARVDHLLVDQGTDDQFLGEQLKTGLLALACKKAGIAAQVRMQEGYDHSYFTVSTFMAEHIAWHAARLGCGS